MSTDKTSSHTKFGEPDERTRTQILNNVHGDTKIKFRVTNNLCTGSVMVTRKLSDLLKVPEFKLVYSSYCTCTVI